MKDELIAQLEFFSEAGVTHLRVPPKTVAENGPEGIVQAEDPSEGAPESGPDQAGLFVKSESAAEDSAPSADASPQVPEDSAQGGPVEAPGPVSEDSAEPPSVSRTRLPDRLMTLEEIRRELGDCQRCPLCETRSQIVFGVGDPNADLMFVGEAPGADEDALGLPFVGRAGALLSKIVLAIGLNRDQVYVANILKCRPPQNRDPIPEEVEKCEPFLFKQIETVAPKVIVALGRYAAQTILRSDVPISRLRGQWKSFRGVPLMPTFHPSYLLRNPSAKREVWQDMQAVQQRLKVEGSRYSQESEGSSAGAAES